MRRRVRTASAPDAGETDAHLDKQCAPEGSGFGSIQEVMEAVLRSLAEQLGMRSTWVARASPEENRLEVLVAHNEPGGCDVAVGAALPLQRTLSGGAVAALEPAPLLVDDTRANLGLASLVQPAIGKVGSYLDVPIFRTDGTLFGILGAADPEARTFSRQQADLALFLARLLATHLDRDAELAEHTLEAEALGRLRRQYELILQSAGEGIYGVDRQGITTSVNPAAARMLGYQAAELIGRPWHPLLHHTRPDGTAHPQEDCPIHAALQDGAQRHISEDIFWRKDGSSFPVEYISTPIREGGDILGAVVTFKDITERKRAEEERARFILEQAARAETEAARQRLTFLAEASQILSSSLDYEATLQSVAHLVVPGLADWCIMDVVDENRAIHRVAVAHAEPGKQELARKLEKRYSPDWDSPQPTARALRTGQPFVISDVSRGWLVAITEGPEHLKLLREMGICSLMAVPLVARGHTLGAITFVSGVSRRRYGTSDQALAEDLARRCAVAVDNARLYREAQEAVRVREEERDRLLRVLDVTPEGIAIADARGRIVLSNREAREIWGQPPPVTDVVSYDVFGIYRLDSSPCPSEEFPLARSILHGEVVRAEQLLLRNRTSGALVPLLVSSAPVHDAAGAVIGGVAVFQDISPIKDLERQKEEFLAAVSHDLKNPLTTIKAVAQMHQRRGVSADDPQAASLRDGLKTVERTASRIAAMLDEFLDVTRLQMGRPLDLDRQPTDLVALAQRVAADHQQMTERHQVRVESTVAALDGHWDAVRLERVLGNLLANAIKYSPDGGEVVLTLGDEEDATGTWAVLRVRDQGVGIPVKDLPRVFDRFYRGTNVAGKIPGSGIGLAGARQIVEQHGGTITVQSQEGMGSTFTVRLPRTAIGKERAQRAQHGG
jgi:PAS domain S-box-containing protein